MSGQPTRDDEQQPLEAVESPGKRLRIARQARGMSQGDIASHLHLSQAMVQALETDDYDRLPGPVFVRGYLRNYARLMGLDDGSIQDGYGGTETKTQRPAPVHQGVKPEIRSSHFAVRLMTWIIVLGLLGLVVAWWQGHLEWNNGVLDQAMEAALSPPGEAQSETGGMALPQPEPEQAPGILPEIREPTAEPALSEPPATELPEPPDAVVEVMTEESVPEPVATTEPAPDEAPQVTTAETTAVETAAEAPAEETEPGAGSDTKTSEIVFEFLGPCWVDIRDSTRKFKLFGEMIKGRRQVLEGTPPYSVIIGNSAMVRVTVDGRPFDIEPLSHGSVARFTLDPSTVD